MIIKFYALIFFWFIEDFITKCTPFITLRKPVKGSISINVQFIKNIIFNTLTRSVFCLFFWYLFAFFIFIKFYFIFFYWLLIDNYSTKYLITIKLFACSKILIKFFFAIFAFIIAFILIIFIIFDFSIYKFLSLFFFAFTGLWPFFWSLLDIHKLAFFIIIFQYWVYFSKSYFHRVEVLASWQW